MNSTLYYLHALSALHIGTGQGVGVIDLPIAREKATHLPYAPGSGIKGVLREDGRPADGDPKHMWEALFGPTNIKDNNGFAGALTVGDAHLLCLPVRSLSGTFAWVTSSFVLARYTREAVATGASTPNQPTALAPDSVLTTTTTALIHQGKVLLEDLDLNAQNSADSWADYIADAVFPEDMHWQSLFKQRFAILSDGVFDFLADTATEIRARVRIDQETRTVAKGALWYEENLPAESIMYGLLGADRARKGQGTAEEMLLEIPPEPLRLQLGGKATVGRGVVRFIKGKA